MATTHRRKSDRLSLAFQAVRKQAGDLKALADKMEADIKAVRAVDEADIDSIVEKIVQSQHEIGIVLYGENAVVTHHCEDCGARQVGRAQDRPIGWAMDESDELVCRACHVRGGGGKTRKATVPRSPLGTRPVRPAVPHLRLVK